MSSEDITFLAHRSEGEGLTIKFPMTLDSLNAPKAKDKCLKALFPEIMEVRIDLTATTFLDSAGIGLIVTLYRRAKEDGFSIELVGAEGQPLSLIQSLQIDKVIPLNTL